MTISGVPNTAMSCGRHRESISMKNALIVTTISGFLLKFEVDNVRILQDMGYTVHYAANGNEQGYLFSRERLKELGIVFHHIDIAKSPFMIQYNLRALKQLTQIIHREQIQLLHCHTPVGGLLGRLSAMLMKEWDVKVLYTAHGFHFYHGAPLLNNTLYYAVERLLAKATDALIVINHEDYDRALHFRLKKGGKIYYIPGVGIDLQRFVPYTETEKRAAREKHGVSEEAFLILSVGELNENKNHEIVLKAVKKLKANGNDVVYGICGDGFYREKLRRWIQDAKLTDSIILYGYCEHIQEYIGMADVILFPSKREGLGMAALEALAMGIPVIAASNRGTREYIRHGYNGYSCDWNDVEQFVKYIIRVQKMEPDGYREMSRLCRISAEPFDVKYTHEIMKNVYEEADRKALG